MKSVVYLLVFLFSFASMAQDIDSLDGLAGIYKITPITQIPYLEDGMSIEYEVAISKKKDEFENNIIGINEFIRKKNADGTFITVAQLKCSGTAEMSGDLIMTSSVVCNNDASFEQKINLTGVKDLTSKIFTAPVFGSLYGVEIQMSIERLKDLSKG